MMRVFLPVSSIHKVYWQDAGTSQSCVLPADLFDAWEGRCTPKNAWGRGRVTGGSLNAKQSLREIDGGERLAGAPEACRSFIAVIYGLAGASATG